MATMGYIKVESYGFEYMGTAPARKTQKQFKYVPHKVLVTMLTKKLVQLSKRSHQVMMS